MKAVIRKLGTIYGAYCYLRPDKESLGPRHEAFVFESYTDAGRWVDDHELYFVIEPARTV